MYDFANILFSGKCSAHCEFCIGRQVAPELNQPNLHLFPPHNLERFLDLIIQNAIRQVVLTGTNTDPQLYQHEERLLDLLRQHLPPETRISLHTNARQALAKLGVFNRYDRATLSIPSFEETIYQAMMGVARPPDLAKIMSLSAIPLKISCLVTARNAPGLAEFLQQCQQTGIPRVVLRKRLGDPSPWTFWFNPKLLGLVPRSSYRGNPIYMLGAMEVTLWDFDQTKSTAINLFSNGQISTEYHLIGKNRARNGWHSRKYVL